MAVPDKFNVSGSPETLQAILPVLQLLHEALRELKVSGGGIARLPVSPEFADYLQCTLKWEGITELTGKTHTTQKSFRLKSVDPRTVSLQSLQTLANRIYNKFKAMPYKTGHIKVKYTNWPAGIQTWGYFDSSITGTNIIEALCDIANHQMNRKLIRFETVGDVSVFDPTPDPIQIANKTVRPKAKAPIANLRFQGADLYFPYIDHIEPLVDGDGYYIQNLDFLKAYAV